MQRKHQLTAVVLGAAVSSRRLNLGHAGYDDEGISSAWVVCHQAEGAPAGKTQLFIPSEPNASNDDMYINTQFLVPLMSALLRAMNYTDF